MLLRGAKSDHGSTKAAKDNGGLRDLLNLPEVRCDWTHLAIRENLTFSPPSVWSVRLYHDHTGQVRCLQLNASIHGHEVI